MITTTILLASYLRRASGVVASVLGWVLMIVGVLFVVSAQPGFVGGQWAEGHVTFLGAIIGPILDLLIGAVLLGGGSRLRFIGRRLRQRTGREILSTNSEYVLLLRAFELDKARYVDQSLFGKAVQASPLIHLGVRVLLGEPVEAPFVLAFRRFYPVLAIGRPGERLPALGAARLYVGANEWRPRVEQLISRARLIVMVAGSSSGVQWELQAVARADALKKLVVYIPKDPYAPDSYDERWKAFRADLNAVTTLGTRDLPTGFVGEAMIVVESASGAPHIVLPPSVDQAMIAMRETVPLHVPLGWSSASSRISLLNGSKQDLRAMASKVLELTA